MSDIAIHAENLGKRYRLGQRESYSTFRDLIRWGCGAPGRMLRRGVQRLASPKEDRGEALPNEVWALKDVSLEVKQGEVVGVIGRNGAGKSTLLKVLTRITKPTTGHAEIHGRVGSLLEVGTGFHPELTGRENVYLNGAILGMRRHEIKRKFDEIVDFSGVEKFLDTPVKRYSSGMRVRLAFAVAANLDPEILLIDEVLAVGDAEFQRRCLGKMEDVARGGRTVLFVSHNMAAVRRLCSRGVMIRDGQVVMDGDTASVVDRFLSEMQTLSGKAELEIDPGKAFQLTRFRTLDEKGEPTSSFNCDQPIVMEMTLVVREVVRGVVAYFEIRRSDGVRLMVSDSNDDPPNLLRDLPKGEHVVRATIPPRCLGHGDYVIYVNFATTTESVDSPGVVSGFRLDDLTSVRGNTRLGYLSALMKWERD